MVVQRHQSPRWLRAEDFTEVVARVARDSFENGGQIGAELSGLEPGTRIENVTLRQDG